MKKYAFRFTADWTYSEQVKNHHFLLRCMPGTFSFQRTYAHSLTITPNTALGQFTDSFGNQAYSGTIIKPHPSFSLVSSGFVLCSKYIAREPLDRLFLYPALRTGPSAEMRVFMAGIDLPEKEGERAVRLGEIVSSLMAKTEELPLEADAAEAFAGNEGGTKDFAQVYVTLCRMAKLPARYVIGLAKGIDSLHSWGEVYYDGVWNAIDPSLGKLIHEGYLKFAHGTDTADCSLYKHYFECESGYVPPLERTSAQVYEHMAIREPIPHE